MKNTELIPDEYMIFASLLIISNRMDTMLERELKEFGVTTKQWFLTATIDSLFDNPPTMTAVAREMGSSYQNIKQVALKLQQKGLLELEKDKKDARVTRLRTTEQCQALWEKTQPKGTVFMENMFKGIDREDLLRARNMLQKIQVNLNEMDNGNRDETEPV